MHNFLPGTLWIFPPRRRPKAARLHRVANCFRPFKVFRHKGNQFRVGKVLSFFKNICELYKVYDKYIKWWQREFHFFGTFLSLAPIGNGGLNKRIRKLPFRFLPLNDVGCKRRSQRTNKYAAKPAKSGNE